MDLSDVDYDKLTEHVRFHGGPNNEEWLTAIAFARWNGLRLMDAVNIRQNNVVDEGSILDFVCAKTGERMVVPLHPVCQCRVAITFCHRLRLKSKSQLSQCFTRFLERAGVENPVTVSPSGRELRAVGFHSLRHSFITWLKASGVSEEVSMTLAGHRSRKIHQGYNHVDLVEEARKITPW
jgi:integrase